MYVHGLDRVSPEGYVEIHPIAALQKLAARRVDLQKSLTSYNHELTRVWGTIMRRHRTWIVGPNYWTESYDPSYHDITAYINKYCPGTIKTTPKDVRYAHQQYVKAMDSLEALFTRVLEQKNHSITISSKLFMFLTDSIYDFDLSGYHPLHV